MSHYLRYTIITICLATASFVWDKFIKPRLIASSEEWTKDNCDTNEMPDGTADPTPFGMKGTKGEVK